LNVFRSLSNIYAQVIDDTKGCTLAAASTLDGELASEVIGMNKTDAARRVGALVAKRAVSEGITRVVFDRGGYKYHGRVKALAEGARESGLKF
jgi:large subunit ribosomal protein L18